MLPSLLSLAIRRTLERGQRRCSYQGRNCAATKEVAMLGSSRSKVAKQNAAAMADLTAQLVADAKFRKKLLAAVGHGAVAQRRARRRLGVAAVVGSLAADRELRRELAQMWRDLEVAWSRVERKRSHRARTALLVVGAAGVAGAAITPASRQWLARRLNSRGGGSIRPQTIEAHVEVEVPIDTAYNQWTQFEEFPRFMDGVEEVRQLDDTRLHWVATVGGKRAEWDAKILEQHPDRQISWISEDGRKTRGTVSFESLGASRTLIRLSMSYQSQGVGEALGSAAGLDSRRVRGDLERFKQLIEERGTETGEWRGHISAGRTT
jgi:uncharacterized membrane protein